MNKMMEIMLESQEADPKAKISQLFKRDQELIAETKVLNKLKA
jgi:hypothetical protein